MGVLLTKDKQAAAFTVTANLEPVPVAINIERTGSFSRGIIVDEKARRQDPRKRLQETMATITSVEHQEQLAVPKAKKHRKEAQAPTVGEREPKDECPESSAQDQAVWFIDKFLKDHGNAASMKSILAVLAKKIHWTLGEVCASTFQSAKWSIENGVLGSSHHCCRRSLPHQTPTG